jgi:hypothetical protein
MIPRGVRDYIVRQMGGRSIEGYVRRGRNSNTGEQLVILSITANDATFSDIEGSILNSDMWDYMNVHREPRQTFSHRNFRILRSWNGAIRGKDSDPDGEYEYKSPHGSRHSNQSHHGSRHSNQSPHGSRRSETSSQG